MAGINRSTRFFEGDWHGEPHPRRPDDLWCAGCLAWTTRAWWWKHVHHAPPTRSASA
ncbi:MAG TPA: hypothetical protein VKG45_07985 [Actinomycetes bacterium]|nr:hypothetical protein [Actinomycetes bacterium]